MSFPRSEAEAASSACSVIWSEEPNSRQLSEMLTEDGEEGEAMEDTNEDDAAMMAMMGMTGFGTTKVKRITGRLGKASD